MRKARSFTGFEFYFVISIIGIIVLLAIQHYRELAEQTKYLGLDVIGKNFNAAVHNYHARWILLQPASINTLVNDTGLSIRFSAKGWPQAFAAKGSVYAVASVTSCLSLWHNLLQGPPPISYEGGMPYGTYNYHLSLSAEGNCRFELVTEHSRAFYFEYSPVSGQVLFHTPAITKK